MGERFVILGSSRGLGAAFTREFSKHHPNSSLLLISRKIEILKKLKSELATETSVLQCDFSNSLDQEKGLAEIIKFQPTRAIYFAGGGPFGNFSAKSWKDHLWSFEVTFLFAARLLHFSLNDLTELKQITFIGSAIAEADADPRASSYAAAKHGLKGLIKSVREEKPKLDIRLFSPGYMDTELLPANAWPRQHEVLKPEHVARDLVSWLFVNDDSGIKIYK